MSTVAGRPVAALVLVLLVASLLVVIVAPGAPGGLRLAGISLLWWYAVVGAPFLALCLAVPLLAARSAGPVPPMAFWAAPVLPLGLAGLVFDGAPEAPAVALGLVVAPLLGVLGVRARGVPLAPGLELARAAGAALVLGAGLAGLVQVGEIAHVPRLLATLLVAASTFPLALALRRAPPARDAAVALGSLGFVASVAVLGTVVGVTPWAAWRDVGSREALRFAPTSAAVTHGRIIARATTLVFSEPHRITAVRPGVYRVIEGVRPHEWRLRPGDSLELRPGDQLVLEAGAHVRFEAGRRVPTAPLSGIAWAHPSNHARWTTVVRVVGVSLTLLVGAIGLVPLPDRRRGLPRPIGPLLVVSLVVAAASLGVWGVRAAPELAIGAPALGAPLQLAAVVFGDQSGRLWFGGAGLALILMLAGAAAALATSAGAPRPPAGRRDWALHAAMLLGAAALGFWPGDPWRIALLGLGLAASAVGAPSLGGGSRRAQLVAALVGALVIAGISLGAVRLPPWAAALGEYPVLVAVPLAWAVSRSGRVAAGARG